MAATQEPLSLCATCNQKELCTTRKESRSPILECGEFDDAPPPEPQPPKPAAGRAQVRAAEGEQGRSRGLCLNCRHRDDCTLSALPGGVWHCEEYA